MSRDKRVKPEPLSAALSQFLTDKGLNQRVFSRRARSTTGRASSDRRSRGSRRQFRSGQTVRFCVAVTTNAWMNELSLMEPELIRALNIHASARRVKKIRFQLKR